MKTVIEKTYKSILKSSPLKRCRNVYFAVRQMGIGSSITRGYQMSRGILKNGVFAELLDLAYCEEIPSIRDSVIVFIKNAFCDKRDFLYKWKEAGNVLIWDPLDDLDRLKDDGDIRLFDGALMPHRQSVERYAPHFSAGCRTRVVYHHWDPRCRPNTAGRFRLAYLGDPTPDNIRQGLVDHLPDLEIVKLSASKDVKLQNIFELMTGFSCHFSVRDENRPSFDFKPNAKLTFAAGMRANIITSREPANLELLDNLYPFYTTGGFKDVLDTVNRARDSFGTKTWDDALAMMDEVRERTSLPKIAKDYINFFRTF